MMDLMLVIIVIYLIINRMRKVAMVQMAWPIQAVAAVVVEVGIIIKIQFR